MNEFFLKNNEALEACTAQLDRLDGQIIDLKKSREKLDKRLDFLLDGRNISEAEAFRQEYRAKTAGLTVKMGKRKIKKENLEEQITAIHDSARDMAAYGNTAKESQRKLAKHDPIALGSAHK